MSNRFFAISAVGIVTLGAVLFFALSNPFSPQGADAMAATGTTTKELVMTDVSVGSGAEAVPQKTVTVHYTGWLQHPVRQFQNQRRTI